MCSVGRCKIVWPLIPDDGPKKAAPHLFCVSNNKILFKVLFRHWICRIFLACGFSFRETTVSSVPALDLQMGPRDCVFISTPCLRKLPYHSGVQIQEGIRGSLPSGRGRFFPSMKDDSVSAANRFILLFFLFFVWLFFIFRLNARIIKLKSFMCSCVCRRVIF